MTEGAGSGSGTRKFPHRAPAIILFVKLQVFLVFSPPFNFLCKFLSPIAPLYVIFCTLYILKPFLSTIAFCHPYSLTPFNHCSASPNSFSTNILITTWGGFAVFDKNCGNIWIPMNATELWTTGALFKL